MDKHVKEYLDRWVEKYENILRQYYPAHDKVGFTERNLTVNFAHAVEELSKEAFTWYEAPISNEAQAKFSKHLDAVVFDFARSELFLVEAKRFNDLEKKLASVGKDIARVCSKSNAKIIKGKIIDKNVDISTVYGIIIADVWTKRKPEKLRGNWGMKQAIFDAFSAKTFVEDFAEYLKINPQVAHEHELEYYARKIKAVTEDQDYNLLALVFKTRQ